MVAYGREEQTLKNRQLAELLGVLRLVGPGKHGKLGGYIIAG
jgi:hypothetical protein